MHDLQEERLQRERVALESEAERTFGRHVAFGEPAFSYDPTQFMPKVLSADWREMAPWRGLLAYQNRGLRVLIGCSKELDERKWLHVSLSRRNMIPTYDDLREVKDQFIGRDRTALQVFPPADKHVNLHPYVLHLWCCVDGDVTPDFTRGGESL